MNMQSERLTLRPWKKEDEAVLAKHANNPRIAMNLRDRFPSPYTLEDAKQFLRLAAQDFPPSKLAIEVEGESVGGMGLIRGDDVYRLTAEVGYWLAEPYWGKGLATEALKLFIPYAFEKFGVSPLLDRL